MASNISSPHSKPIREDESSSNLVYVQKLIDNLQNNNDQECLNSIKKLSTIALALGVERTRIELIPILTVLKYRELSITTELAEQLGYFTRYVGGSDFVSTLLTPLEHLAASEESAVRDKVVQSLRKLALLHSTIDIENQFIGLMIRLTSGYATSRISACSLFSTCYPLVNQTIKSNLVEEYSYLCQDDSPLVRKAAAKNLDEFAKVVDHNVLKNRLIPISVLLSQDKQDSVRIFAVEACINIASLLTYEDFNNLVMPTLNLSISDSSWRVRYMVANNFSKFHQIFGFETKLKLIPIFISLLSDTEAEIRAVAASKICDFCLHLFPVGNDASSNDSNAVQTSNTIGNTIVISLLPVIRELISDANHNVRLALSSAIIGLSPILGRQRTLNYLFPLIQTQLLDNCPDVCLNLISHIECLSKVIGIQQISPIFLAAFVEQANNPTWRIRQQLIECTPLVANQIGSQLFDEHLSGIYVSWFTDSVFAVRHAATVNLKKLVEIFGVEWLKKTILPKILCLATNPNYLFRNILLRCTNELSDVCDPEMIVKNILPIVLSMSGDKIGNIRFNVAKTLQKIGPPIVAQFPKEKDQIKRVLDQLVTDLDNEVHFFAVKAMSMFACDYDLGKVEITGASLPTEELNKFHKQFADNKNNVHCP